MMDFNYKVLKNPDDKQICVQIYFRRIIETILPLHHAVGVDFSRHWLD